MKKIYTLLIVLVCIHAFSQSGNLDATFGNNGKVHTGFGTTNATAAAVAVQPDGKIIVGGSAYTANTVTGYEMDTNNAVLVRYNADGSRDTSFGNEGVVMNDYYTVANAQGHNSDVVNIKVLADGKILTYGGELLGYVPNTVLARYNNDGSLDTSFGTNGHVLCGSTPIGGADSLLILPDGKIVVLSVQLLNPSPGVYTSRFAMQQYSADGVIDTSFGTDGTAITSFGFGHDTPRALALQSDGKIVAAGVSFDNKFALARYTSDGQLDTTFDGDGKVTTSFGTGTFNWPNFVSVHADGKILVAGSSWGPIAAPLYNFAVARYNSNGSIDTSFDSDGKAVSPLDASDLSTIITSVLEQPDGKLLVTSTISPNYYTADLTDNFTTRRYHADAAIDTAFGTNGMVSTAVQPGYSRSKIAAVQPDGTILVAGFSHPPLSEQNDFSVVRYESNGVLDTSFGSDGKVFTAFESTNDESAILLLQPDNKLITIGTKRNFTSNGYFLKDIALSRYNSDGSPDALFGTAGKVVSVFGTQVNYVRNAVIQPDGKIVVSNTYYGFNGDVYHYELIRYTTNGSVDETFGTNGKVTLDFETTSLLSQPDGKIITTAMGFDSQDNFFLVLKRFNNDGTLDTSFGTDGITTLEGIFYNGIATALQPDGKIIISVQSLSNDDLFGFATYRFNTDGSLDADFETTVPSIGSGSSVKAIFLQPDGKIIIAGTSQDFDGFEIYYFVTARYNPDGSLDTTYGTNGILKSFLGTYYDGFSLVQSVVLQPDGKFVATITRPAQNFVSNDPNSFDFVVVRYDTTGNFDADFGTDGKVITGFYNKYDEAFSMVLQSDNKIVVAGSTDTGINRDFALVRYENTIDLGVNQPDLDSDFILLYPNPAKDMLHIKTSEISGSEIISYSIYNMLGQIVYRNSDGNLDVPTLNFSKGIYSVLIRTNKGTVSKKMIKE